MTIISKSYIIHIDGRNTKPPICKKYYFEFTKVKVKDKNSYLHNVQLNLQIEGFSPVIFHLISHILQIEDFALQEI